MGYVTWHYSLVCFQSPISASTGGIKQSTGSLFTSQVSFSNIYPQALFPCSRNVFSTFSWLCLGLSYFIASQLLVPCQAQRCIPVHELLLNLGTSSEVNGWAVNSSNDKLFLFLFHCLNCSQCKELPVNAVWTPASTEAVRAGSRKGYTPKTTTVVGGDAEWTVPCFCCCVVRWAHVQSYLPAASDQEICAWTVPQSASESPVLPCKKTLAMGSCQSQWIPAVK